VLIFRTDVGSNKNLPEYVVYEYLEGELGVSEYEVKVLVPYWGDHGSELLVISIDELSVGSGHQQRLFG
jgi:hypothetical protein